MSTTKATGGKGGKSEKKGGYFMFLFWLKLTERTAGTATKPAPTSATAKARNAKKAALQGTHSHATRKTRTSVTFHRPKVRNEGPHERAF